MSVGCIRRFVTIHFCTVYSGSQAGDRLLWLKENVFVKGGSTAFRGCNAAWESYDGEQMRCAELS